MSDRLSFISNPQDKRDLDVNHYLMELIHKRNIFLQTFYDSEQGSYSSLTASLKQFEQSLKK